MKVNIYKIAAFIFRNHPPARDWGAGLLVSWLAWHLNNHGVIIVFDDSENIVGAGVARTVMRPEDAIDGNCSTYNHDPEGSIMYVDLAVATSSRALVVLILEAKRRFGLRDWIAYRRRGETNVRVLPYRRMRSKMVAITANEGGW